MKCGCWKAGSRRPNAWRRPLLVFTTDQVGFVIHGPAASPWLPGELWTTEDGGATWTHMVVALS